MINNDSLARIIKNPERAKKDYQVLCRNCNWIKHRETMKDGGDVV